MNPLFFLGRVAAGAASPAQTPQPIGGLSSKLRWSPLKVEDDRPGVVNAYGFATFEGTACAAIAVVEESATSAAAFRPTQAIAFGAVQAPPVAVAHGRVSISPNPAVIETECWTYPPADHALAEILGLEAVAEEIA